MNKNISFLKSQIKISYQDLPIKHKRQEILNAIENHQIIIVCGETGSGKTTQLPKICYEYLCQQEKLGKLPKHTGIIGCTQPRRLAATSVSERTASEMNTQIGDYVGYQIRFNDSFSDRTIIKFMTDGILLAEVHDDPLWQHYSFLIIDEAHERSLNIDFILGYLKSIAPQRKDLKIIISSATLDFGHFAEFYDNAPVIQIEGKTFPVELHYQEPAFAKEETEEQILRALLWTQKINPLGDTLVFLPGEREILETMKFLNGNAKKLPKANILPLYSRLDKSEQALVFKQNPNQRKIILATNVAETSLTIPGIIFVIDSGLVKINRFHPQQSIQRLQTELITQANAKQRMGRCGRTANGVCIRLYSEELLEKRPGYMEPEIRRSSLADTILRMKILELPEIQNFPFLNPPSAHHIAEGKKALRELYALDSDNKITKIGKLLARFPIDVRLSRMILTSNELRCVREVLVIASFLSVGDVRDRPAENPFLADKVHRRWNHPRSDFLAVLNIWRDIQPLFQGKFKRSSLFDFCQKNYLNFMRILDWYSLQNQLTEILESELNWRWNKSAPLQNLSTKAYADIHCALLSGIPTQFGFFDKKYKSYHGGSGKKFLVFPGSGLYNKDKNIRWLMAFDLVETKKLYARKVAVINPEWLEKIVPHICQKRYEKPHWNRSSGFVTALENTYCDGIKIIAERSVNYSKINPAEAREIFIRKALIPGTEEFSENPSHPSVWENEPLYNGLRKLPKIFLQNSKTIQKILLAEIKLRRIGDFYDAEETFKKYSSLLPDSISSADEFNSWWNEIAEKQREEFLFKINDITILQLSDDIENDFPDWLEHKDLQLPLHYYFMPGDSDDGICLECNFNNLLELEDWVGEWLVPGLLEEKVIKTLATLPKHKALKRSERKQLAKDFMAEYSAEGSFLAKLAEFLTESLGKKFFKDDFDLQKLPSYLQMKFWVSDAGGGGKVFNKNLKFVKEFYRDKIMLALQKKDEKHWKRHGVKSWDFGDLPRQLKHAHGQNFIALCDEGGKKKSVAIKVLQDEELARKNHIAGVARLFCVRESAFCNNLESDVLGVDTANLLLGQVANIAKISVAKAKDDILLLSIGKILLEKFEELPYTQKGFENCVQSVRENLYDFAGEVLEICAKILDINSAVEKFLQKVSERPDYAEVSSDLHFQMRHLLRNDFLQLAGVEVFLRYLTYFEGIIERIEKLKSQPLAKDLEKTKKISHYWRKWISEGSYLRNNWQMEKLGWSLQEYRLHLFAPKMAKKGLGNEKQISESLL